MSSYNTPPVWPEDRPFEQWLQELEVWRLVTELAASKQAPAVLLSLSGERKEVGLRLTPTELSADDGLNTLIAKLKEAFGHEGADRTFELYLQFEQIIRDEESMTNFIQKFEAAYNRIEALGRLSDESIELFIMHLCKMLCRSHDDQQPGGFLKQLVSMTV